MKLIPPFVKGPISVVHFITKNCNARCSHCFIDFDNPITFKDDLTLDEIDKLTKSVGHYLSNVNITGGEPFLRRDIFDIAKCYFTNTRIRTMYITTNGFFTGLIKDFIDKFISANYTHLLIFSISIDDFPERHDANRKVNGLFENAIKTYNAIKDYKNKNILANINITVMPANYERILDIYNYLVDIVGIKSYTTTIIREEGVMKIPHNIKEGILNSYKNLNKKIKDDILSGKIDGYTGGLISKALNAKNIVLHDMIEQTFLNNSFITPCYAGGLFLVIDSNGDVKPCEVLTAKLGNLREYDYDLIKLWNSENAIKLRKTIIDTKCRCTYECAYTINILSNSKHTIKLLKNIAQIEINKRF